MIPQHDARKAGRFISRVKLNRCNFEDTTSLIPSAGTVATEKKPPKDEQCSRKRINWKMADILTPSTISTYQTMDNSSVAGTLRTCATETTLHTMTSTPAALHKKSMGDGAAAPRKIKDSDAPVQCETHSRDGIEMTSIPSKPLPVPSKVRDATIQPTLPENDDCHQRGNTIHDVSFVPHAKIPLPPLEGEIQPTDSRPSPVNIVSPNDSPELCSFSPSMPLEFGTFESSSSCTTLTPLSPTRLMFEDVLLEGEVGPDELEGFPPNISYLDVSPSRNVDSPSSEGRLLCDEELRIVLFPRGAGLPATSPLTPSPELISPPTRRPRCRQRRPPPFLLEKMLTDNNSSQQFVCSAVEEAEHDGYNSSIEASDFSFLRHDVGYPTTSPKREQSPVRTHRRQRSFSEETPVAGAILKSEHRRRTKSLEQPKDTLVKSSSLDDLQSALNHPCRKINRNDSEKHLAGQTMRRSEPRLLEKGSSDESADAKALKNAKNLRFNLRDTTSDTASAKEQRRHSDGHLLGTRPKLHAAGKSKSCGAIRTTTKSVPVDVDEVQFVDVENHLQTIEDMAVEHMVNEEYEEALVVFKEILRGQLERHGYEHERVGTALHNIGIVHLRRKSFGKAVQVSEKAVHIRRLALGFEHSDVATSLVQLGFAQFELQKYSHALRNFREALHIRRAGGNSDGVKVAKLLNNIACTLKQLGDGRAALVAFEEALALQRAELDSLSNQGSNPDTIDTFRELLLATASSLSNICTVKISLDELDQAYAALEEALMVQKAVLGEEHPEAQETQKGLAYIDELRAKRGLSAN